MDAGKSGGHLDMVVVGQRQTEANVLGDRVIDQHCILQHDAETIAQPRWVTARTSTPSKNGPRRGS